MGVWFLVSFRLDNTCRGVVGRMFLPFILVGMGHKVQGF